MMVRSHLSGTDTCFVFLIRITYWFQIDNDDSSLVIKRHLSPPATEPVVRPRFMQPYTAERSDRVQEVRRTHRLGCLVSTTLGGIYRSFEDIRFIQGLIFSESFTDLIGSSYQCDQTVSFRFKIPAQNRRYFFQNSRYKIKIAQNMLKYFVFVSCLFDSFWTDTNWIDVHFSWSWTTIGSLSIPVVSLVFDWVQWEDHWGEWTEQWRRRWKGENTRDHPLLSRRLSWMCSRLLPVAASMMRFIRIKGFTLCIYQSSLVAVRGLCTPRSVIVFWRLKNRFDCGINVSDVVWWFWCSLCITEVFQSIAPTHPCSQLGPITAYAVLYAFRLISYRSYSMLWTRLTLTLSP